jgi:hypothetical protein
VSELGPLLQEGLGQAVMAVVPLLLAGLVGSAVAGWLAVRMGLQDPVMAGVLRGLCVLGALVTTADELGDEARRLASETWGGLAAVGRAEAGAAEAQAEPEGSVRAEGSAAGGESTGH